MVKKTKKTCSQKILIISNTAQGLYNFRIGLLRALRDSKFEVCVVATKDEFVEKIERQGFKYIPVKHLDRKGVNPIKDIKLMLELHGIYKRERPDLVIHYTIKPNIYGSIACRLAGVKSFCVITGLGYVFIKKNVLLKVVKLLYRISFSFANKVFFLNNEDKELFIEQGIVSPAKSILLKGEGINIDYFSPEFCQRFQKKGNNLSFLLIARMLWDKGVGEFVKAAEIVKKRFPDIEFQLLGPIDKGNPSGISENKIKEWEGQGGLIKYLGTTDDVRPFICKSDCVILPSYREGVPRSLLEAMAMAKPIITTDSVGCKEVIENGKNGFLIPIKNSKALAMAMIKMIELPEKKRREMGEYGRNKVIKEFDEKIIINTYLRIIQETI